MSRGSHMIAPHLCTFIRVCAFTHAQDIINTGPGVEKRYKSILLDNHVTSFLRRLLVFNSFYTPSDLVFPFAGSMFLYNREE